MSFYFLETLSIVLFHTWLNRAIYVVLANILHCYKFTVEITLLQFNRMRETCRDDIRRDRRESSKFRDCASILVALFFPRRNWKPVAVYIQRARQFSAVLSFDIAKAEQRLRTVIS